MQVWHPLKRRAHVEKGHQDAIYEIWSAYFKMLHFFIVEMTLDVPPANLVSMCSTLTVIDGASALSGGAAAAAAAAGAGAAAAAAAAGAGAAAAGGQVIVIDMLLRRTLAVPWSWTH